jgi:signal transduction histidine kinase
MDIGWRYEMQLWKKNFLASYLLFLTVFHGGLLLLNGYISKNEMEQWVGHARNSEKNICYLVDGLREEEISRISMKLSYVASQYAKEGIFIRIKIDGYAVADHFPEEIRAEDPVGVYKRQGEKYLVIREERTLNGYGVRVDYAESMAELSRARERRILIFCGTGLLFSAVIGVFLYYTMQRINRPVNQIAHELRTPLTGIRGYAEYIMMGNLSEEDRFYAAGQIVESAKNLQEVMEKLLIMGNVRDGSIRMERVSLGALLKTLEEKYPGIETDCQIESVEGDKTLLLCMLENLTANGLSAGRHVKVTANAQGIRIWNDGETMDEKDVKAVNKGQEITGSRVGRHGYGIQVCREIARAHGWRLVYRSSSEEGTTASAVF